MIAYASAAAPLEGRQAERLRQFLNAYRTATRPHPGVQKTEALATFFGNYRELLSRVPQPAPSRPHPVQVNGNRLTAFLSALKAPLVSARMRGEFTNVWTIAGLKRNEVRNAAVLAWLLRPLASHGLGDRVLRELFAHIPTESVAGPWHALDLSHDIAVQTEECPLGDQADRVDISVTGRDFVLFIEVKIDAAEGDKQLERYAISVQAKAKALRKKHYLVVFLSPRSLSDAPAGVVALKWRDVTRAIRSATRVQGEASFGVMVARQYADHIDAFV